MAGLRTGRKKSGRSSTAQRGRRRPWTTRCCRRSPRQSPMSSSPHSSSSPNPRHLSRRLCSRRTWRRRCCRRSPHQSPMSSRPNARHLSSVRPRSGMRSASIAQRRNGKSFWRRLIGTHLGRPMTWHCIPSCRRTCSARLASSSSILHLRKVAVIFATRYGARIPGASALEEVVARSTSTKGMVEGA